MLAEVKEEEACDSETTQEPAAEPIGRIAELEEANNQVAEENRTVEAQAKAPTAASTLPPMDDGGPQRLAEKQGVDVPKAVEKRMNTTTAVAAVIPTSSGSAKENFHPVSSVKVKDLASNLNSTSTAAKPREPVNLGSAQKVKDMASSFKKKEEEAAEWSNPRHKHCDLKDPCNNPGAVFGAALRATPKKDLGSASKLGNESTRLTNMSEKVRAVATSFKLKAMAAEECDMTPSKQTFGRTTPLKSTPCKYGGGGNENTRITNMSNHVREAATNFKEKAFAANNCMTFKDPSMTTTPAKVKDILASFNTPQKGSKQQSDVVTPSGSNTAVLVKLKQVQPSPVGSGSANVPKVVKTKLISQAVENGGLKIETPSKVKDFVSKVQAEAQSTSSLTPSKVKMFVEKAEKIQGGSAANTPSKVRDFAATFAAKIDEQKAATPQKSVIAASPFKKFEKKQESTLKKALNLGDDQAATVEEEPTDPRSRKKEWKRAEVFANVKDAAAGFKQRDAEDSAAELQASQLANKARATFQEKITRAALQMDRSQWSTQTPEKKGATGLPATTSKLHEMQDKENMSNSPKAPKSASKVSTWSREKALGSAKKKELEKGWFSNGDSKEQTAMRKLALEETESALEDAADEAVDKTKAWLASNREEHERVPPGLGFGFRV